MDCKHDIGMADVTWGPNPQPIVIVPMCRKCHKTAGEIELERQVLGATEAIAETGCDGIYKGETCGWQYCSFDDYCNKYAKIRKDGVPVGGIPEGE